MLYPPQFGHTWYCSSNRDPQPGHRYGSVEPWVPHNLCSRSTSAIIVRTTRDTDSSGDVLIGGLDTPALLADLARAERLSLILIGHRRSHALGQVPDRADRLRFAEIVEFDPYDADALFTILDARREVALQRGVVDDAQLERIVAEAGGPARFGVQALRSAIDLGIERGHTTVQPEDIDDCFQRANERIRRQQLESLGRDHHLVYRVIREHGPVCPQSIYERYTELGGEKSRQSTVKYRTKLDEYDLIEQTVDGWIAVDATLAAPRREQRVV